MKQYFGIPSNGGSGSQNVCFMENGGSAVELNPRRDLIDHAPGFSWGKKIVRPGHRDPVSKVLVDPDPHFLTGGASQLALALLMDVTGKDDLSMRYHQRFKLRVMGDWERNKPFQISDQRILNTLESIVATENDPQTQEMRRATERGPVETDMGRIATGEPIIWDTDEKGNRIRQREEG